MIKRTTIICGILFLCACSASHSLFRPEETDVAKVNSKETPLTLDDLNNGYHLYTSNCSGCHSLYRPAFKRKPEWEKVLPEMFSKTQLNSDQQKLIRQYIFSKL